MNFKILIFYLIQVVSQVSFHKFDDVEPEFQRSRFKSLKCKSLNETLIQVRYCRVKVSRNSSGLAVNLTLLQKITKPAFLRLKMNYKYGLIYREVFKVPEFEFCGALKNFDLLPPFMKAMFDILGDSMAILLKGCPFQGELNFLFEADMSKFPSILPSGFYKCEVWVSKEKGSAILYTAIEVEVVSNIRTSFRWSHK